MCSRDLVFCTFVWVCFWFVSPLLLLRLVIATSGRVFALFPNLEFLLAAFVDLAVLFSFHKNGIKVLNSIFLECFRIVTQGRVI